MANTKAKTADPATAPKEAPATGEPKLEPLPDEAEYREKIRLAHELDDRRYKEMLWDAKGVYKATQGWCYVRDEAHWDQIWKEAKEGFKNGRYLLNHLGAERHLEPTEMATVWVLRQSLVAQFGANSAAAMMLVDLAIISYANAIRVQGWVGNLALVLESELFAQESLRAKFRGAYGSGFQDFEASEKAKRLREELLPLFDRANRAFIRNLKALRELLHGPVPTVNVARADQVNVGAKQANAVIKP